MRAALALAAVLALTACRPDMLRPVQLGEDQPGWDCRTMGNGACGPTVDVTLCGPVGNPLGCPTWEDPK